MNHKIGSNSRSSSDFGGAGKWLKHPIDWKLQKKTKKKKFFKKGIDKETKIRYNLVRWLRLNTVIIYMAA